jgi:hypothetical protein
LAINWPHVALAAAEMVFVELEHFGEVDAACFALEKMHFAQSSAAWVDLDTHLLI